MIDEYVDGDLLFNATQGNRSAIKTMARLSADLLLHIDKRGESFTAEALIRVSNGEPPNTAFGWTNPPAKKPTNADKRVVIDATTASLSCIKQRCRLTPHNLPNYLFEVLSRIARGSAPNKAMNWETRQRGTSIKNTTVRDWLIRKMVQDNLSAGMSREEATGTISADAHGEIELGEERIKQIANGIAADSVIDFPSTDVFPMELIPRKRL